MQVEAARAEKPAIVGQVDQDIWFLVLTCELINLISNEMRDGRFEANVGAKIDFVYPD